MHNRRLCARIFDPRLRASPLALFVQLDDPNTIIPVVQGCRLTNPNRVNEEASIIYTSAIATALRNRWGS